VFVCYVCLWDAALRSRYFGSKWGFAIFLRRLAPVQDGYLLYAVCDGDLSGGGAEYRFPGRCSITKRFPRLELVGASQAGVGFGSGL
jgi:hypothetical protein